MIICACSVLLAMSGCVTGNSSLEDLIAEPARYPLSDALDAQLLAAAAADQADVEDTPLADGPRVADEPENPNKSLPSYVMPREVTIQPESVAAIAVKEDASLDGQYRVNGFGAIQFGYMGIVFLDNMTAKAAQARIVQLLEKRGFKKATVTVKIVQQSYDTVIIDGAVGKPGAIRIAPGSGILLTKALLRVGSLNIQAKRSGVKIVRGGMLNPAWQEEKGEVYWFVDDDGKVRIPKVLLRNNDIANVFADVKQAAQSPGLKVITVVGEVGRPGEYRFNATEPCTMLRLLFKLAPLPKWAGKAIIIRTDKEGDEKKVTVDAKKLLKTGDPKLDVPLENGDRVMIKEKTFLFP